MKSYHGFVMVAALFCAPLGCYQGSGQNCTSDAPDTSDAGEKSEAAHAASMASYAHDDNGAADTVVATFVEADFSAASAVYVDMDTPPGATMLVTFTGNVKGDWAYRASLRLFASVDGAAPAAISGAQTYLNAPATGESYPIFIQGILPAGGKVHVGVEGKIFAGDGMDLFGAAALVAQVFPKG